MATPKPQIRTAFATPICVHYLPVAPEVNAELRPLILDKMQAAGDAAATRQGWRSEYDFVDWGGSGAQTLFRMLRELSDSMTATRTGGRVTLEWVIAAAAAVRQTGDQVETVAQARAFWSGIYFVDDGYGKADGETFGGECEFLDPRGDLPASLAPQLAFRIPGGTTAGTSEVIRPKTGMILLHPGWLARGERRFDGQGPRVTVEFELTRP
ncbi:MAG TPA: putative 2OG-Fe(II) oxygenase [Rhizomicrobium sp.]|jgi:hypothetical protein|nr:putative 2OG-Fe(II) oxygenase [Rhizomicrobium sp.]